MAPWGNKGELERELVWGNLVSWNESFNVGCWWWWWGLPRGTKTVPFHHVAVLLLLHGFFCFVLCALTSFASYTLLSMRHRSYALLPFYPLERVAVEGRG